MKPKNILSLLTIICLLFALVSCDKILLGQSQEVPPLETLIQDTTPVSQTGETTQDQTPVASPSNEQIKTDEKLAIGGEKTAYFAGGCFWCIEGVMDGQVGVSAAISGYAGGTQADAVYDVVSTGKTDHREGVKVSYDSSKNSYEALVKIFLRQIDPTDAGGQFADRGFHYTTAIYYQSDDEKAVAEKILKELETSGKFDKPIAVKILPYTTFFPAEEYHQNYSQKSAQRYKAYAKASGRVGYIEETWTDSDSNISPSKKPLTKEEQLKKLTPLQYSVTQEDDTETPFDNIYWDNKEEGIYVDIVDGTPLFSSLDKYDSGTGWPSFVRPLVKANIKELEDNTFFTTRTEIRSSKADSHLGHMFTDGPTDRGGLRYCMNSAALRFIPLEELEAQGYGEYVSMFSSQTYLQK